MNIVRDSISLFGGRAVNAFAQMILVIAISRTLGPEPFGVYSFFTAIILLGNLLAGYGLDIFLVRELSRQEAENPRKLVGTVLPVKIILAFFTAGLFIIINIFYHDAETQALFVLYSLILLFRAPNETLWYVWDGLGNFRRHSFLWAAANILRTIFGLVSLLWFKNLGILFLGLVLAEVVAFGISFYLFQMLLGPPRWSVNFQICWEVIKNASPIALSSILGLLYLRLDTLMLEFAQNNEVVGYYNAAFKIFEFFAIVPGTLMTVLFPMLSRNHASGRVSINKVRVPTLTFLALCGILFGVMVSLFSDAMIQTIYGSVYSPALPTLNILARVIVFYFINFYWSYVLISMGKENINIICLIGAIAINGILNIILIPEYAHLGAAWAKLISEAALMVLYFISWLKLRKQKNGICEISCLV